MNSPQSYMASYAVTDRILGQLLASEPGGLVLSIDIGGSFFDSIVRSQASVLGYRFAGFPSLLKYRSTLRVRGRRERTQDVLAVPVMFGKADGLLRIIDDNEGLEGYSYRHFEVETRSIDAWCAGRPTIRLIHFGDPELAFDQILGAAKTLALQRPILTLYTTGLEANALIPFLNQSRYDVFDLRARPVHPAVKNRRFPWTAMLTRLGYDQMDTKNPSFGWIAIPNERAQEFVACWRRASASPIAEITPIQTALLHSVPSRQLRSLSVFNLPAKVPTLYRSVRADEILASENCSPPDGEGDHSSLLCGPTPRTRLFVPCAVPGFFEGEILVEGVPAKADRPECRVLAEGRESLFPLQNSDLGILRFAAELEPSNYAGYLTLDIVETGLAPPAGSPSRARRMRIRSVALRPCQ